MRRSRFYLGLMLLLMSMLLGLYTNCSSNTLFSANQESGGGGSGTVVGNPKATNQLLSAMCSTIVRCHSQVTAEQCEAGLLRTSGLGPRFGLPASFSGEFAILVGAEETGDVRGDSVAIASCVAQITALDCSSSEVQQAYDPVASQPFSAVTQMVPSGGGSCSASLSADILLWTWMGGSDQANQKGVYGTQGTASPSNIPGARSRSATGQSGTGTVYMFGGIGYDSTGNTNNGYYLNDLWKWDGANWTWLSGSNLTASAGVYGTKGVAANGNRPGGREISLLLVSPTQDLWLFGGYGNANVLGLALLNDLWRRNASTGQWTWVAGANTGNTSGVYGARGVPSVSNYPGAREGMSGWIDSSGNVWIFGGYGYGSAAGVRGNLNDLWRFNPQTSEWTWVAGSNVVNSPGSYGTKTVAAASNAPRARSEYKSWVDASGSFWIFGGYTNENGTDSGMNDLWKWDGTNWTWMSGSSSPSGAGIYGTVKVADSANTPGARSGHVTWRDAKGVMWLFGGYGHDSTGAAGNLNDLWKFDGTNWTWVSGSRFVNEATTYGLLSVPNLSNTPGAREHSAAWIDSSGAVWLFGGASRSPSRTFYSDLWRFEP